MREIREQLQKVSKLTLTVVFENRVETWDPIIGKRLRLDTIHDVLRPGKHKIVVSSNGEKFALRERCLIDSSNTFMDKISIYNRLMTVLHSYTFALNSTTCISLRSDGQVIAIGHKGGQIAIAPAAFTKSLPSSPLIREVSDHAIGSVVFAPDLELLAAGGMWTQDPVVIFDYQRNQTLHTIRHSTGIGFFSFLHPEATSADSNSGSSGEIKFAYALDYNSTIESFPVGQIHQKQTQKPGLGLIKEFRSLPWSSNVVCATSQDIVLWDIESEEMLPFHSNGNNQFSPVLKVLEVSISGLYIVAAYDSGKVNIWDATTHELVASLVVGNDDTHLSDSKIIALQI